MSDITIYIEDRDGQGHSFKAPTDMNMNLMELCKANDLDVEGTCGGMAMCASCHCYVLSDHALHPKSEDEEDMLDQAFFVEEHSRLACQIPLRKALDGLKIKLAPNGA